MSAIKYNTEEDLIQLMKLNREEIEHLLSLGILKTTEESCQSYHIGKSDYSRHIVQPWNIWLEYGLNPWDADIVKRVLRTKEGEERTLDYEKIIHVCRERIRQLEAERTDVVERSDEADYKTVMCPSEKDKPKLLYQEGITFNGVYEVYGVFQSSGRPYAYLGCKGCHVYLDLGRSNAWSYFSHDWVPKRTFSLSERTLNCEDHAVSMAIGGYGVSYEKHDYIITCDGRLFRYFGMKDGKFSYRNISAKRADGAYPEFISIYKLENKAIQFTL